MTVLRLGSILMTIAPLLAWAGGDSAVEAARRDLAARLQVQEKHIAVVSQIRKTWPDASLGCPQRGMAYAQMVTSGMELVLDVAGQLYVFTAADGSTYVYCARPSQKRRGPIGPPIQ